jgi:hypothetical protein
LSSGGKSGDKAVLNKNERGVYLFLRSVEAIGGENDHIAFNQELDQVALDRLP